MKKIFYIVATVVATITTMFSVIAAAETATLNFKPLYYIDIAVLDIEKESGMSRELLVENYRRLIEYNSMFNKEPLQFRDIPISDTGRIHFEEVRNIFVMFQEVGLLCLIISIILGAVLIVKFRRGLFLKLSAIITVTAPAAAGVLMAVNWDRAFVLFHEIAFDNDYWLFDSTTDPIIDALPDEFFLHCAIMILVLVAAICGGMLTVYGKTEKQ